MNPRFIAYWLIVAAQLALLVGMAGFREAAQNTGAEVILQTGPVDPRSLMQGDYAILTYEIGIRGRVPNARPALTEGLQRGARRYVTLERQGDVWQATGYHRTRPRPGELFITGRADDTGRLDFGIGTYFVPEGAGHIVERAGDVKVVAQVDPDGNAVITGLLVDGVSFEEALKNEQRNR